MIEMELNKIIIDEKRHDQVIVLKERKGERLLPIVIGSVEASAIKMEVSGFTPPRPLTHDLLLSTITELDSRIDYVLIDKLEQSTYHAKLYLKYDGKQKVVDARPSDSIALAVRAKAPIFVEEDILKQSNPLKEK